jgi:hypothetical protein
MDQIEITPAAHIALSYRWLQKSLLDTLPAYHWRYILAGEKASGFPVLNKIPAPCTQALLPLELLQY